MEKCVLEGAQLVSEEQLKKITVDFTNERALREIEYFLSLIKKESIFLKRLNNGMLHVYAPGIFGDDSCFQLVLTGKKKTSLFIYRTSPYALQEKDLVAANEEEEDDTVPKMHFAVVYTKVGFISIN